MNVVLLEHDRLLGIKPGHAGVLPPGWSPPPGTTSLVTFRYSGFPVTTKLDGLNATTRFLQPLGEHVLFYAVETDTFLAPLLLWDAAHSLPVGGTLTTVGDTSGEPYLLRDYFRSALRVERQTNDTTVFRKVAPLLIEQDKGLDRWTFGIPTGPGDATGLNACVKRILELGVPEFEIVLCGVPGDNFLYRDRVRIVGEELTKPPVYIGRKKNVIAEAARYENLCIMHDRVFLPTDFLTAVRRFGDLYPIHTFQAIWFDDPGHLSYRRYSDYNRMLNPWLMDALTGTDPFTTEMFTEIEQCGFVYQNPLRYHQSNYCNGSLYLCKRAYWRAYPQNPNLKWSQFEDVEWGMRASRLGVPSRVNPYTLSQSMFARPVILYPGVLLERAKGRSQPSIGTLDTIGIRRKPLVKMSKQDAVHKLHAFARKRMPPHLRDSCWAELSRTPAHTSTWLQQIGVAVYAAAVGFGADGVDEFITDYEQYLIGDELGFYVRRMVKENFAAHAGVSRDLLVENSHHLENLLLIRPNENLFYDCASEYFPRDTLRLRAGSALAAARLAAHNGEVFYHPDGFRGFYQSIRNSTPFRPYFHGTPTEAQA